MSFTDEEIRSQFQESSREGEEVWNDEQKFEQFEEDLEKKKLKGGLFHNVKLLHSLVQDYRAGVYTELPMKTIFSIIGVLVYVISPIDLIPDLIPVLGLTDDAALVALALKFMKLDIVKYEHWKNTILVD